jgi:hypothetical protein
VHVAGVLGYRHARVEQHLEELPAAAGHHFDGGQRHDAVAGGVQAGCLQVEDDQRAHQREQPGAWCCCCCLRSLRAQQEPGDPRGEDGPGEPSSDDAPGHQCDGGASAIHRDRLLSCYRSITLMR